MIHMQMTQERMHLKKDAPYFHQWLPPNLGGGNSTQLYSLSLSKGVIQQSLLFPLCGGIDIELEDSFSMSLL